MKCRLLKSKKGMTLVEVVVSMAILSILAVFIMSVFAATLGSVMSNSELKKSGKLAAAGIENKLAGFEPDQDISVIEQENGFIEVDFGSIIVNSEGYYIIGKDKNQNSKYYFFIPE
jgi:prepilin-type N-terminal cleavage/methylation domain-containing protein